MGKDLGLFSELKEERRAGLCGVHETKVIWGALRKEGRLKGFKDFGEGRRLGAPERF